MRKLKESFMICLFSIVSIQLISAQDSQHFMHRKGDDNISVVTMGNGNSPHCTVIEYPEFLVLNKIPIIPSEGNQSSSETLRGFSTSTLIAIIDNIYLHKTIKYVLNSHHHSHILSTIMPFLEICAKLVTAKEDLDLYNRKGLFDMKTSTHYSSSIIQTSSDTVLLAESGNPIEVFHLKKAAYGSIPTETFLFFNFPKQKLMATSCLVYLKDVEEKYGYRSFVYNNRLINVRDVIGDKKLETEDLLQLYRFRQEDNLRKPPVFSITHFQNVLKDGWQREALSEDFQNLSCDELTSKKDSILTYLVDCDIYHAVVNHAVYELINKREYQKAVALAHILVIYTPDNLDYVDSLGEAYFNNGQLLIVNYYDKILRTAKTEELGFAVWETNQKNRLKNIN